MMNSKKTTIIILASLTVLIIGVFGYMRYAEFCQPTLQSDAYNRDQIKQGILVQETNPAIIQGLNAGLKEAKRKMSWGQWWLDTGLSGCRNIFPPQPFPTLPAPFMPTITPPQLPPQTQAPADTRSWGERFRDKTIPEVPGVTWQTYTNNEYGFEMEYPVGWQIETQTNGQNGFSSVDTLFTMQFSTSKDFYFDTFMYAAIYKKNLQEFIKQDVDKNSDLGKRFLGHRIVPDTVINGIGIVIDRPDLDPQGMPLRVSFERDGYSYVLNQHEPGFDYQRNSQIAEHMIKTFRFLK